MCFEDLYRYIDNDARVFDQLRSPKEPLVVLLVLFSILRTFY